MVREFYIYLIFRKILNQENLKICLQITNLSSLIIIKLPKLKGNSKNSRFTNLQILLPFRQIKISQFYDL